MKQYAKIEDLIEDVRKIDSSAADYIKNSACHLRTYSTIGSTLSLQSIFVWSETPQGKDYWFNIHAKLGELNE